MDQTVPVVITAWEALYAGWYNLTIAPAFIPPVMALAANNTANGVLAQNVATQGGRTDTAPRMLHGNAMMVRNQLEWSQLVKHYKASGTHGTSSDDRKYAAEILLASRDTFSTNRTGSDTFFLNTLVVLMQHGHRDITHSELTQGLLQVTSIDIPVVSDSSRGEFRPDAITALGAGFMLEPLLKQFIQRQHLLVFTFVFDEHLTRVYPLLYQPYSLAMLLSSHRQ